MNIFIVAVIAIIATNLTTNKPADVKVEQTKPSITTTTSTPKTTAEQVKPSNQVVNKVEKPSIVQEKVEAVTPKQDVVKKEEAKVASPTPQVSPEPQKQEDIKINNQKVEAITPKQDVVKKEEIVTPKQDLVNKEEAKVASPTPQASPKPPKQEDIKVNNQTESASAQDKSSYPIYYLIGIAVAALAFAYALFSYIRKNKSTTPEETVVSEEPNQVNNEPSEEVKLETPQETITNEEPTQSENKPSEEVKLETQITPEEEEKKI